MKGKEIVALLDCSVMLREGPSRHATFGLQYVEPRECITVLKRVRRNAALTWLHIQTFRGKGWIEESFANQLKLKALSAKNWQ